MALTATTIPPSPQFALHPIIYQIDSNDSQVHSIRCWATTTDKSVNWNQMPDIGTSDTFTVDLHEIAEDWLSYDLQPIDGAGIFAAPNSIVEMWGYFFENIKVNGQIEAKTSMSTDDERIDVLNAGLPYDTDLVADNYVLRNATFANRFLCSDYLQGPFISLSKAVRLGESEYLSGYTDGDLSGENSFRIRKTNIDGSTADLDIPLAEAATHKRFDVGVGPANINAHQANFIDENVRSYIVFLVQDDNTKSFTRSYQIDNNCYTSPTRVHFLNRWGGFDSFTFNATEKKRLKTSRERYQRYLPANYSVGDRGRTVQEVNATESLLCTSDALREYERLWLEELLTSPEVFIQKDGNYLPVIVKDGTFEITDAQKSIFTMKVELEYAQDVNVQRG